jgi:hypothetical protein
MTERPTTYNSSSESFLVLHVYLPQTDVLVVAAEGTNSGTLFRTLLAK